MYACRTIQFSFVFCCWILSSFTFYQFTIASHFLWFNSLFLVVFISWRKFAIFCSWSWILFRKSERQNRTKRCLFFFFLLSIKFLCLISRLFSIVHRWQFSFLCIETWSCICAKQTRCTFVVSWKQFQCETLTHRKWLLSLTKLQATPLSLLWFGFSSRLLLYLALRYWHGWEQVISECSRQQRFLEKDKNVSDKSARTGSNRNLQPRATTPDVDSRSDSHQKCRN